MLLETGCRVGVIAQPDISSPADITRLGTQMIHLLQRHALHRARPVYAPTHVRGKDLRQKEIITQR